MRYKQAALVLVAVSGLGLATLACAPAAAPAPSPEAAAQPQYGGTLTTFYANAIRRWDPSRELAAETQRQNSITRNTLLTYRFGPGVSPEERTIVGDLAGTRE